MKSTQTVDSHDKRDFRLPRYKSSAARKRSSMTAVRDQYFEMLSGTAIIVTVRSLSRSHLIKRMQSRREKNDVKQSDGLLSHLSPDLT